MLYGADKETRAKPDAAFFDQLGQDDVSANEIITLL
jgi:hypothetical protein